jgi:hypothetical protein
MSYLEATLVLLGRSLANRLGRADPQALRRFARACALFAVLKTRLSDETIQRALEPDAGDDEALVRDVRRVVDSLDEKAFLIREAHEARAAAAEDYLAEFSRARAAESVLAQLEEREALVAAVRSAYEARAATGDKQALARLAEGYLRPVSSPAKRGPVDADVWRDPSRGPRAEAQACS